MKNLKPIIFTAHSELKTVLPSIKKSHLYEAFASFCGFKSYAAFQSAFNVNVDNLELANRQCFERLQGLGFDAGESLQVCQHIEQAWEHFNNVSLDNIYTFYMNATFEEALASTSMLNVLTSLVDENDTEASLMGLVFSAQLLAEYDEDPDNRSGEYWYNKKLANHTLNELQSEVAGRYNLVSSYREFFNSLLKKLEACDDIELPSPEGIKASASLFEPSYQQHWTKYFSDEPHLVLEAQEYILKHGDLESPCVFIDMDDAWLKADVLQSPSRYSVIELIDSLDNNEEKWFWHYVGLSKGIDVTKSNLRAINAYTGEDYDDYGPMDVVGDEGLSLPAISDDKKAKIERQVKKLTPR
ncbi:hypothetical protein [Pseudocolwellia agarivorans]|uniref:hypothetical protein n=1 Tax=Pseudocolwellia agarivorans TaxID=1911682 RepID=UPI000987A927|nr:hypothetical protein [Pseudocolwellia agarivorans]